MFTRWVSIPDRDYKVLRQYKAQHLPEYGLVSIPDRDYKVLRLFRVRFIRISKFVSIPDRDYKVLRPFIISLYVFILNCFNP